MRKLWLLPFLILLAACAAGGGGPIESPENADGDNSSPATETPPEVAPAEPLNNEITIGKNPTDASVVRDRDWTKGAEDPLVTIIEYGDFQ